MTSEEYPYLLRTQGSHSDPSRTGRLGKSANIEGSRGSQCVPFFFLPLLLRTTPGLFLYITSLVSSNQIIVVIH